MDDAEESAVAKSTGLQEEKDMAMQDTALFRILSSKKKISKSEANYKEEKGSRQNDQSCIKCKFNLAD